MSDENGKKPVDTFKFPVDLATGAVSLYQLGRLSLGGGRNPNDGEPVKGFQARIGFGPQGAFLMVQEEAIKAGVVIVVKEDVGLIYPRH